MSASKCGKHMQFDEKQTPDHWSGGLANILNKQHNSDNCSQPPDHLEFGGFVLSNKHRSLNK